MEGLLLAGPTPSSLHRIMRQSELSVFKALECRNVIQLIQDGKDIIFNKGSKTILIPAFRWSISCLSWLFKMCMEKGGYVSRNGKKAFFAAVELHCLISENKLYHK